VLEQEAEQSSSNVKSSWTADQCSAGMFNTEIGVIWNRLFGRLHRSVAKDKGKEVI